MARRIVRMNPLPHPPSMNDKTSAMEAGRIYFYGIRRRRNYRKAVAHLQQAVSAGWADYRSLSLDPRFDNVATDQRVQRIIGRLKLRMEELYKGIRNSEKTASQEKLNEKMDQPRR